eukprot:15474900-Alexandrium_andersonii.AAC.1
MSEPLSAISSPLTRPQHVRTPGWEAGSECSSTDRSPGNPDASSQRSEALLAPELPEALPSRTTPQKAPSE